MRRVILLGNPGTKRTDYLRQAAVQEGLPVLFEIPDTDGGKGSLLCSPFPGSENDAANETGAFGFADWRNRQQDFPGDGKVFLKIDPPLWESSSLNELNRLTAAYERELKELAQMEKTRDITFLNHPSAIAALLDKDACKKRLAEAGLPVTEQIDGTGKENAGEQLLYRLAETGIHQVFIKPLKGSGAAGVSAFRYQPATGRMALYTCAALCPGVGLVNTKRLRRFSNWEDIFPLLDEILKLDCILERWYAKAEYQGFSYDLRAVMQDGKMDFLLARLSKGPITNLHLNNHPLRIEELQLSESVIHSVTAVCQQAMECFPGLRSAGIDILLEKGSLHPRIIEMNGQGDLIYQDIYHENRIYRHQARMMLDWLKGQ